MRARRHIRRPPDLTSLFDVLFIVVFAALIRAAAVEDAAAHPPQPAAGPSAPATPPAVAALRQRALAELDAELASRTPVVVRITRDGAIDALEVGARRIALAQPLLEPSPDPDVVVAYRGDRSPDLRICRIAALQLGNAELSRYLVIMAPALPFDDLPHALFGGLHRDVDRCLSEQRTLAVLVDPLTLTSSPAPRAPATLPGALPPTAPPVLPPPAPSPSGPRGVP
jgi:hypothetical protein